MNKKIVLILTAFLCVSALASCSTTPSANDQGQSGGAEVTTEAAVTEESSDPEVTEEEYVEPDYPELVSDENSITFDDGEMLHVPGNLMGTFGSNVGEDCSDWYVPTGSASEYATAEWQCSWVHTRVEGKWLLKGFVDGTTDSTLVFMRWSIPNQADVYIDNLTFYDEDGKSIPIIYGTGEAAAETESEDVTSAEDEAPVTDAAPEAEENTETTEETGGENGAE